MGGFLVIWDCRLKIGLGAPSTESLVHLGKKRDGGNEVVEVHSAEKHTKYNYI